MNTAMTLRHDQTHAVEKDLRDGMLLCNVFQAHNVTPVTHTH